MLSVQQHSISAPMPEIQKSQGATLLMVLAVGFFAISILISGGFFAFKKLTERSVSKLQDELGNFRESLQVEDVQAMIQVDRELRAADKLLKQHTRVSPVFSVLEAHTLQTVQLTSFSYDTRTGALALSARALNDRTFVEQLAAFRDVPEFSAVEFGGLKLGDDGTVEFSLDITVDINALLATNTAN